MKILFVEPPKAFWFVMGEYLPPPLGILQLAAYLEEKIDHLEIEVLDCQAHRLNWKGLERRIESLDPDIVASSSLATCNAYVAIRTLETAKRVKPTVLTVVGGQHFTATAHESLANYPVIDIIVRGEGEDTLVELIKQVQEQSSFAGIRGVSYRHDEEIRHNPPRPLIENLNALPFPGYHFVDDVIHRYHFNMMAEAKKGFALVEGSRGCSYHCSFCSQWRYWSGKWRHKSMRRIVDEMVFCYHNYGIKFFWLTDDNFGLHNANDLCDKILSQEFSNDIMWFIQARCDDVVEHSKVIPKMRKAGNYWILMGVEHHKQSVLDSFNKGISPGEAWKAVKVLKNNDIFTQATFIIGERRDSTESIGELRAFVNDLDPDLAIFMVLTPFPGTQLYELAEQHGWIEDQNWSNYDMVHAIMPTETLSRREVQEELYTCYRDFYGSLRRRLKGLVSKNKLKRKTYRYLASQGLLMQLENLL